MFSQAVGVVHPVESLAVLSSPFADNNIFALYSTCSLCIVADEPLFLTHIIHPDTPGRSDALVNIRASSEATHPLSSPSSQLHTAR